ncbi:hypothetical protein IFM89_037312 [Coptis chinensis]|uniref:H15 domain-containing protein n=1 Tax=Coptis chinensis TaxID=261450 RepID=A0A835LPW0_9MAGN|nr:hypothetical protein IFM89_037312 [Coptis chinensis]
MEEEGSSTGENSGKLAPPSTSNPSRPSISNPSSPSISNHGSPSSISNPSSPCITVPAQETESALSAGLAVHQSAEPSVDQMHSESSRKRSYSAKEQPSQIIHYSQMVLVAISELNEKNGSTEENILKYIEAHYRQSPIFFKDILKFILKSLAKAEEIEVTPESTYVLPGHYKRQRIEESEADAIFPQHSQYVHPDPS